MSIFKGNPGPSTMRKRISYSRARGLETSIEAQGSLNQINGLMQQAIDFSSDVEMEHVSSEPYARLHYSFPGIGGGGGDSDPAKSADRWQLTQREHFISIYQSTKALEMEALEPGAIRLVKIAVNNFKRTEDPILLGAYTPAEFEEIDDPVALGYANEMFALIVSDVESFRTWQPIILLQYTVPWDYPLQRTVPQAPVIYQTTNALTAAIGIPATILYTLPQGKWLEQPPQITSTAEQRFEISQTWEFYETISEFLYPQ